MPVIRQSKKRDAMLSLLRGTKSHPSADWLYHQMRRSFPDISLGTVYRNLGQLTQIGLVKSVGVVDGQERFDADMSPHSHFVCRCCGAVLDLPPCVAEEEVAAQCTRQGLRAESSELLVYGVCSACAAKDEAS